MSDFASANGSKTVRAGIRLGLLSWSPAGDASYGPSDVIKLCAPGLRLGEH